MSCEDNRRRGNAGVVVPNRVSAHALRHLPRTTRWKVQLGLLDLPPVTPPPDTADGTRASSGSLDRAPPSTSQSCDPLGGNRGVCQGGGRPAADRTTTTKTASVADDGGRSPSECQIYECSASKLSRQRERFESLARDHMWRNSPLDLIEQEKKTKNDPPPGEKSKPKGETSSRSSAPAPAPVVDDPLSAFVREREEAERAEAAAAEAAAEAEAEEEAARRRIEARNGEGGRSCSSSSSQWTGFYTNREVIDLINKDLHRLSPRLVLPPQQSRKAKSSPSRTSSASGGLSSFCASSSDDEDDMDDDDDDSARMGRDFRKLAGPAWERRREDRLRLLSDVLFLYSMEHPDIGYRQGMHEVLAHVVLALEMDMMMDASTVDDAGGDFVVVPRLQRASSSASASSSTPHAATATADLRMDAYLLFEAWMDHLKPAYMDEHASSRSGGAGTRGGGNAAAIGDRVLELLRHESTRVHSVVSEIGTRMGAPPQLYLVGWMRLLFGRVFADVAGTLDMWDCLLDLLADPPRWSDEDEEDLVRGDRGGQRDDDDPPPRPLSLMDILECAACGMILLQAPSLLSDGGGGATGDDFDDPDDDDGVSSTMRMHDRLSLLMNYPPLSDVGELRDLTVITARDRLERRSRRWQRRRARRRRGGDGRSSPPDTSPPAAASVPGEISVEARVAASAAAAAAVSSGPHHQRTQQQPPPGAPQLGAVVVGCPEDDLRRSSSTTLRHGLNNRHLPQPPPQGQRHLGRGVPGAGADGRRGRQQQQHWDGGVALSSRVGEALDRTVVSCRGFIAKAEGRISQEIANMEGRIKSHEVAVLNTSPPAPHGSSTSPITGSVSVGYHQGGSYNSASSPLVDGGASSALSPQQKNSTVPPCNEDEDEQGQHLQWRQDELLQRSKLRERLRDISNGMDAGLKEMRDHLMLLQNRSGGGAAVPPMENGGAGSSSDSRTGGNVVSSSASEAFQTIPLHPSESKQQQQPPGEGVLETLRRLEALQLELASLGEEL